MKENIKDGDEYNSGVIFCGDGVSGVGDGSDYAGFAVM